LGYFGTLIYNTTVSKILAIETSCDDTCAAIMDGDRVIANVISSQIDLHAKWGGVVPDIAKRAHTERIGGVVAEAFKKSGLLKGRKLSKKSEEEVIEMGMKEIDIIAVSQGPGLAIALGVGINKAKEWAKNYRKKMIAVNHIEGHILSNWTKNREGKPERDIKLPGLVLTVSGGHSKLVLIKKIGEYKVIGETLDDAAGEALDKAAKLMGLGYPGGPVIERLAEKGKKDFIKLPHPLEHKDTCDYSFSGLKTSFYYQIKDWPKEKISKNLNDLSATFQEAVFESLIIKFKKAIKENKVKSLLACGGVMANSRLRSKLRRMAKEFELPIYMPEMKYLNTDNAAMIGTVAYYKAKRKEFVKDIESLDREARLEL